LFDVIWRGSAVRFAQYQYRTDAPPSAALECEKERENA